MPGPRAVLYRPVVSVRDHFVPKPLGPGFETYHADDWESYQVGSDHDCVWTVAVSSSSENVTVSRSGAVRDMRFLSGGVGLRG